MKKIIFLFALFLGIGISQAMCTEMQPPGQDYAIVASADVVSHEISQPVELNMAVQYVTAPIIFSFQDVSLYVVSGSSGGIADRLVNNRELELELYWSTTDHLRHIDKDRAWCTNRKIYSIPVFVSNCNFKFPLT